MHAFWDGCTRDVEQRGGNINIERELWDGGSSFNQGWAAHEQGDAGGFFVGEAALDTEAVLAVEIAFVTGENDKGVLELMGVFQGFEDAANGFVHGGQHAEAVAN